MKNPNAVMLGRMSKGKPKKLTVAEKRRRAVLLGRARLLRWKQ